MPSVEAAWPNSSRPPFSSPFQERRLAEVMNCRPTPMTVKEAPRNWVPSRLFSQTDGNRKMSSGRFQHAPGIGFPSSGSSCRVVFTVPDGTPLHLVIPAAEIIPWPGPAAYWKPAPAWVLTLPDLPRYDAVLPLRAVTIPAGVCIRLGLAHKKARAAGHRNLRLSRNQTTR